MALTHSEFYYLVMNGIINEEVKEKAREGYMALNNRGNHSYPSSHEEDNREQAIYEILKKQTAPISAVEIATLTVMSTRMVSASCRKLMNEGKIKATEIHIRGKGIIRAYSLA